MSRSLEKIPAPVADVRSLFERPERRDSSTRKGLIMMLDLRVLNYFLTVAREESITHAAEALHLS